MKSNIFMNSVLFFLLCFAMFIIGCTKQGKYDKIITNGTVFGGDGNPWYKADIGIKDKKIAAIGEISPDAAKEVIDASGLYVCPGFIDVHTHTDRHIDDIPTADNYLLQGVTTVLGGNCGGHPYPVGELFKTIEKQGSSINFCCLIGHNTIRREVMGLKKADPTPEEMQQMKELIDQEMKAGAIGFSTGLSYMPGTYSDTQEIIELVSSVSTYDGIYASHIRNQGRHITEAIDEVIRIGAENGVRVQISHVKLANDAVWGELERITDPIEKARKKGIEVTIDQYPYTATSSGFASSFPSWCLEGGHEEFVKRLENPENYRKIKQAIIQRRLTSTKGIDKPKTIYIANYEKNPEFEGKNLAEILTMQGKEPTVDNAAELIIQIQKNEGASGVFFQMDEEDVDRIMALDCNMVASDGGVREYGEGVPHPRNYGTFPRIIHRFVQDKHVLKLNKAIRKMTSLPAQTLRLEDRGMLKKGMYADIVVFDPETIKDTATFQKPHQYPEGIKYVIVNGTVAAKDGEPTGSLPGKVLFGQGKGL